MKRDFSPISPDKRYQFYLSFVIIPLLFGTLLLNLALAQEEQPVAETTRTEQEIVTQPLITNIFYDTDILQALRDISAQAGISIIPDGSVQGLVSLEVSEVPLEECLRRLLAPHGYTFRRYKDYYLVGSPKPDNVASYLLTVTEQIKPSYYKAKELASLLSDYYTPFIKINESANVISITASPDIIERFKNDIAEIDKPPRQVLIEALITEVSRDGLQALGIDWSGSVSRRNDTLFSLQLLTNIAKLADTTFGLIFGNVTKTLGSFTYSWTPSIQALVTQGKANIRANPKIVTLDGQKASIVVGREAYYEILTGPINYQYTQLQMIKYGISLDIIPYISQDGKEITLDVQPQVSDVVGQGITNLPVLNTRSAKTQIRVKDGEKIVIGGLFQKGERTETKKIPFLGDIPFLGLLFRTTRRVTQETEVVIFITPHIL
uniref:Type II secretion system protein GspD n=1 Tax=candidate division WOR-3 bacterium TaxID=2052148 RepID=A0A7C6A7W5_UNCW3